MGVGPHYFIRVIQMFQHAYPFFLAMFFDHCRMRSPPPSACRSVLSENDERARSEDCILVRLDAHKRTRD